MRVFPFRAALKDRGRDAVLDDIRAIREVTRHSTASSSKSIPTTILSTASRVKGRYIHIENDEEYPIALSAFNRAIDCYDADKEHRFLPLPDC